MYKRLIVATLLLTCLGFSDAFGQHETATVPGRDAFNVLYQKSGHIQLPQETIAELKSYAFLNGFEEVTILKEGMVLNPFFNEEIPAQNRLAAIDFVIALYDKKDAGLPVLLIRRIKSQLEAKLKSPKN